MFNLFFCCFSIQFCLLLCFCKAELVEKPLKSKWLSHKPAILPHHKFAKLIQNDLSEFNETLSHILIPRVVGSKGHRLVKDYIKTQMSSLKWHVDSDIFVDMVPIFGNLEFENIIASLNPKAERFLTLACHYDSKYFPNGEFLGATDSAVPCAMLIDLAMKLQAYLKPIQGDNRLSLQFVFFDGEEAFENWSDKDSIYGAKHLADQWHKTGYLKKIDMLVLLDLLGTPNLKFYNYFTSTNKWYLRLVDIEDRLAHAGFFEHILTSGVTDRQKDRLFLNHVLQANIEDDHIPFLRKGVPIMHIIPIPFPDEWHTFKDDWSVVDLEAIENLSRIFRVFVVEYLHLQL